MTNENNQRATILAIEIGGDDMGAAWLIARRSPDLTREQVRRAAQNEGRRDSSPRERRGEGESGEEFRERTARREIARRESLASELPRDELELLAHDARDALGEIADALAAGFSAEESAELADVSGATYRRKLAEFRVSKIRRVSETLRWREFA